MYVFFNKICLREYTHTHTHTHTYIYIYIYIYNVCAFEYVYASNQYILMWCWHDVSFLDFTTIRHSIVEVMN